MTQEKRPRRLPSLAAKFILLTGSLIVVTSTIITAYVIRDQIRHSHSDLVTHGMSISVMIAQNSEYGVYTRNRDNLRQIAESCGTDPDISSPKAAGRTLISRTWPSSTGKEKSWPSRPGNPR